jgi:ectoine hydroxylase
VRGECPLCWPKASGRLDSEPINALTEYRQKGYTLVRRMFNSEEIDLLRRSAKQDKALDDNAFGRDDGRGKIVRLSL